MGRASRKRAERRQPRVERRSGAGLERSTPPSGVERVERSRLSTVRDSHRAWELAKGSPSAPSRRPPHHRAPSQALPGLGRLERLSRTRAELDAAITEQVRALVALGTDWGNIGRALGVTRQAARQRYGSGDR